MNGLVNQTPDQRTADAIAYRVVVRWRRERATMRRRRAIMSMIDTATLIAVIAVTILLMAI